MRKRRAGSVGWLIKGDERKRTHGSPTIIRVPGVIGRPDKALLKFRSLTQGSLAGASGAFATSKIAKLNSLLDPFGDVGSSGSIGVDPWIKVDGTGLYLSYRVHAVRFKITMASAATAYYRASVVPRFTSQTAATTVGQMAGQPRARNCLVTNPTNGGQILQGFYTIGECAGLTKEQLRVNDNFAAAYNQDPGSLLYLDLGVQALNGSDSITAYFHVELIQYVELFNPKTLTQ